MSSPQPSDAGSAEDGRKQSAGRRRARRPPLSAILLLGGFVLLVLVFITFRQIRAGETNRLRLLGGFATQVETTVPDLVERYINVVEGSKRDCDVGANLEHVPNLALVRGPAPAQPGEGAGFRMVAEEGQVYLRYVTHLPAASLEECPRVEAGAGDGAAADLPGRSAAAAQWVEDRVRRARSEDGDGEEAVAGAGAAAAGTDGEALAVYLARLDLPSLVQPVVIPEIFDLIVLARRDGETPVLFQHGARELRLAQAAAAWEVRRPGLMETLRRIWSDDGEPAPSGGGTRVTETEIADVDHRVFVQPVTLHLRDTQGNPLGEPKRWVACGVISWQRLLAASFTASPLLLFFLVALFPLMLVIWPFLKMWLISRRQAFTRFDVVALVFATMLGVSLTTLLLLDFGFQSELRKTMDGQLAELAGTLDANLRRELADATGQLRDFRGGGEGLKEGFACPQGGEGDGCPDESVWSDVRRALDNGIGAVGYPPLHSVFWTDDDGWQRWKIPFHPDSVLRNRVADRAYFRCHQAGVPTAGFASEAAVVRLPWLADGDGSIPCLQSIRSKTTAGDLAVLSLPLGEADDGTPPVIALVTRLVSLTHPLLAPGFSFAVIRDDGLVMFHSDPRRNTVEDFLKATGDDPVLRGMLAEDREGTLTLNYWGSLYLAHVRPIDGLPWSFVVLRDRKDLRARNFELLYDFLSPFLLYLLVANLALLLCVRALSHKQLKYLWPSRAYTEAYRFVALAAPPLLGLAAVGVVSGHPVVQCVVALGAPVAAVLAAAVGLWRCEHGDGPAEAEPRHPREEPLRGWRRALHPFRELTAREMVILGAGVLLAAAPLFVAGGRGAVAWLFFFLTLASAYAYPLLRRSFDDRTTVAPYTAALALLLVLATLVPTTALFRLAESRQSQYLIQDTQRGLLWAAHRRTEAVESGRGPLARELGAYPPTFGPFPAQTAASFFDSAVGSGDCAPGRPPLWPYGRPLAADADGGGEAGDGRPARAPVLLGRLLAARPVPLDELTGDPAGTDLSRFHHRGTEWCLVDLEREDGGDVPGLRAYLAQPPAHGSTLIAGPADGDTPWSAPQVVESELVGLGLPRSLPLLRGVLLTLGFGALFVLAVLLPWFIANRVLLIELAPNRRYAAINKILDQVARNGRRAQQILALTSLPAAVAQMARGKGYGGKFHVIPFARTWAAGSNREERRELFLEPFAEEVGDGPPRSLVIIDFKPDLKDPETAEQQIEMLELLWSHGIDESRDERRRSMIVVTSRPYHRLARPVTIGGRVRDEDEREARRLWGAFLARFNQRYVRDEGKRRMFVGWIAHLRDVLEQRRRWPTATAVDGPDWFAKDDTWQKVEPDPSPAGNGGEETPPGQWTIDRMRLLLGVVEDECKWTWRLQRVGIDVVRELFGVDAGKDESGATGDSENEEDNGGDEPWAPPTKKQLVDRIGFAALPYYQRVWDGCERGEKVVLYQLARHGVANPKNFDHLLDLLNKGLVVREDDDPVLRPLNRSFADFIRKTVRHREVWRWEDEEGVSAWSVWKWVLPVPLLLLGLFLFVTQQDAVSNVIGLIVAVASLLPTAVNLYQHFRQVLGEQRQAESEA